MSTHSYIGIEQPPGMILYVYCHFDGYPEGVGRDIANMNREQVQALIEKGDCSTVDEPYTARGENYDDVAPGGASDLTDFVSEVRSNVSYGYLMRMDGTWDVIEKDGVLRKLTDVLS